MATYALDVVGCILFISACVCLGVLLSPAAGLAATLGLSSIELAGIGGASIVLSGASLFKGMDLSIRYRDTEDKWYKEYQAKELTPEMIHEFSNLVYDEYKALTDICDAIKKRLEPENVLSK